MMPAAVLIPKLAHRPDVGTNDSTSALAISAAIAKALKVIAFSLLINARRFVADAKGASIALISYQRDWSENVSRTGQGRTIVLPSTVFLAGSAVHGQS
jgi:hypothetical protein